FIKRDEAFEGWDGSSCTWKGRTNSSLSLYNRAGTVLEGKSRIIYKDLYYCYEEQVDDEAVKEMNLRRATYWYQKSAVQHEFFVDEKTFNKLKNLRSNDYILVNTTITANEFLEEPNETRWSEEEQRIEPGDYT